MGFLSGTGNLSRCEPIMKLSITLKLFLTMFLVSCLAVAVSIWLCLGVVGDGIAGYTARIEMGMLEPVAKHLEAEFESHGDWSFLDRRRPPYRRIMAEVLERAAHGESSRPMPPPPVPDFERPGPREGGPPPLRISRAEAELIDRLCIFDDRGQRLFGYGSERGPYINGRRELSAGGKTIGSLRLSGDPGDRASLEEPFYEALKRNLGVIFGVILLGAVAGALTLSSNLLKPIHILLGQTEKLAGGDLSTRVNLDRSDELGALATNLNKLASALSKNEQSRMQWMADTSHELRTPIAILRAQIEAFQDGVQKVTPKTLAVLHGEIMALNRLVDQLYDLSRADLGRLSLRFAPFDPRGLVIEAVESFENRFEEKGLSIECRMPDDKKVRVRVRCDADMLKQLFSNLLENSLRYTDKGGKVLITSAIHENEKLSIAFEDSAPAVPADLYDKLFERFFRVDSSRSRLLGGTGLGLAICKNIVESHDGGISAGPSSLGGLKIELWLPLDRSAGNE